MAELCGIGTERGLGREGERAALEVEVIEMEVKPKCQVVTKTTSYHIPTLSAGLASAAN